MPKKLDHPRKGLINIQNTNDNECLKWSIVRYVNPADYHSARITNSDKDFAKKLDFEDIKFPVKVRDIYKLEKKKFSSALVLLLLEIKKNIQSMYQKKCEKKHVDLLLIGDEEKRHYVLIKYFNTFMYDHNLHRGRKHFCRYCLKSFLVQKTY